MKVPIERIHADLDAIVEALSDKARQIAVGVLAFVWLFLAGGDEVPALQLVESNEPLLGIAALCILALLCDVLNSVFAYLSSLRVLRDAESLGADETDYDEQDWRRRLQFGLFYAKLFTSSVGALWLVSLLVRAVT